MTITVLAAGILGSPALSWWEAVGIVIAVVCAYASGVLAVYMVLKGR